MYLIIYSIFGKPSNTYIAAAVQYISFVLSLNSYLPVLFKFSPEQFINGERARECERTVAKYLLPHHYSYAVSGLSLTKRRLPCCHPPSRRCAPSHGTPTSAASPSPSAMTRSTSTTFLLHVLVPRPSVLLFVDHGEHLGRIRPTTRLHEFVRARKPHLTYNASMESRIASA